MCYLKGDFKCTNLTSAFPVRGPWKSVKFLFATFARTRRFQRFLDEKQKLSIVNCVFFFLFQIKNYVKQTYFSRTQIVETNEVRDRTIRRLRRIFNYTFDKLRSFGMKTIITIIEPSD